MRRETEERISAVAASQHGVVSRTQLLEAGLSGSAITRRAAAGWFQRVHRGVYCMGPIPQRWSRQMAAVLAVGPEAFVSHRDAAAIWQLAPECGNGSGRRTGPDADDPVHITLIGANRGRRPGIRIHRVARFEPDERAVRHRLPVTSPARTILDLAGSIGSREVENATARALRDGLLDRGALVAIAERYRGAPGTPLLRRLLESVKGPALTRSDAEKRFLALIRRARLPPPEVNVQVGPYEIDFLWRPELIAVEVDGFRYHSSRPRFEADRRRDAWLASRGITVIRLTWRQVVEDPLATTVQVAQALARARPR